MGDNYQQFIVVSMFKWVYETSKNNSCFCVWFIGKWKYLSTLAFMKDKLCNWLGPRLEMIVHMFVQKKFTQREFPL
jgi:hypothetical protein